MDQPTLKEYTPRDWFWIVGGDDTQAWSSAAGDYVTEWPDDQVTRIANESELSDVLRPYGLALPAPTMDDYKAAIQAHIDAVARAKDYDSGVSLAGYKGSPVAEYAADAAAFTNWRDPLWPFVFQVMAAVQAGEISQPTISELMEMLPEPPWPKLN